MGNKRKENGSTYAKFDLSVFDLSLFNFTGKLLVSGVTRVIFSAPLTDGVKYVVFVKMRGNISVYAILILKWL